MTAPRPHSGYLRHLPAVLRAGTDISVDDLLRVAEKILSAYDASAVRPRITLDDGVRLLFTTPVAGGVAPVHVLLSHGPHLRKDGTAAYPGVVDPGCIAALPDGDLLVGDEGLPGTEPAVPDGLWRISRAGTHLVLTGAPPKPAAMATSADLDRPRALAVTGTAAAWQALVLDVRALHRVGSAAPSTLTRLVTRAQLGIADQVPFGMVVDGDGGLLLSGQGQLVTVNTAASPPVVVRRRAFTTAGMVPGPLVRFGGHLVVADLRAADSNAPADLVLLDRTDPDTPREHRMLADIEDNPLVTPVAVAAAGPDALLVLDLGLRPVDEPVDRYMRMAEPAALYRVQLAQGQDRPFEAVAIERVSELGRLTRPTGMAVVDGTAYVSDPGRRVGENENPRIRHAPGHVAVQVHFSRQRVRPEDVRTRRTIAHHVAAIVDLHKPAAVLAASAT